MNGFLVYCPHGLFSGTLWHYHTLRNCSMAHCGTTALRDCSVAPCGTTALGDCSLAPCGTTTLTDCFVALPSSWIILWHHRYRLVQVASLSLHQFTLEFWMACCVHPEYKNVQTCSLQGVTPHSEIPLSTNFHILIFCWKVSREDRVN